MARVHSSTIRSPKDFAAGLLFLAIGGCVIFVTSGYEIGTLRRMGAGFFPVMLGVILCILSLVLIVRSLKGPAEDAPALGLEALRAAFLILLGTLMFGLLIRPAGLFPSIVVMVLLGSLAMRDFGWKAAVLTALVLASGSSIVFVELLGLPVPLLGPLFRV